MNTVVMRTNTHAAAGPPLHLEGRVLTVSEQVVTSHTARGIIVAQKALSCLVEPEVGDRILISGERASSAYVIAVLAREPGSGVPLTLKVQGDTRFQCEDGALQFDAADGLSLKTGETLQMDAARIDASAHKAKLLIGELSAVGRRWHAVLGSVSLVGNLLETLVERVTQHATNSVRRVSHLEQVHCGEMDLRADKNLSVRGRNTLIKGDELVKVDGDQIHLG